MHYPFTKLATVTTDFQRPEPEALALLSRIQPATLHEAAGKIGALPPQIKPVHPHFKVCGPAFTVQGPAKDNLWLHRALVLAQPGDVLVVNVSGAYEAGYWGEVMSTMAKQRGLAGLVINGCVRDGALLAEIGLPVFARGLCIQGTGKDFQAMGWINAPMLVGDVTINPGDVVAGDGDGVVVIPRPNILSVIAASHEREAQERALLSAIGQGQSTLALLGLNRDNP